MSTGKKIVIAVICAIIIIVVGLRLFGGPKTKYVNRTDLGGDRVETMRCIIIGSPPDGGEVIDLPVSEWETAQVVDDAKGHRRAWGYTLAQAIECRRCGHNAPLPPGDDPDLTCPECGRQMK